MKFLDRLTGIGRSQSPRVEPTLSDSESTPPDRNDLLDTAGWSSTTLGAPSVAGKRVTESSSMTLPAVLQAVRILTGVFAMTPLIYYRREGSGKVRETQTTAGRLFGVSPDGVDTPFAFMEMVLSDLLLAGRFVAFIHRDLRFDPVKLTRLDPRRHTLSSAWTEADGHTLYHDVMLPTGRRVRYGADTVWHIRGISRNGLTGIDPLTYMCEVIGGALATTEYTNRFWAADAKPNVVLTTPGRVDQESKRAIKRDWTETHGGSGHSQGVAVLDQDLKPQFLTHDNRNSQFLETRTFQVVDVARAFGVPPHLLFELSKATFGNIEQQSLEFVTYHMQPHYTRAAQAATLAFAEPGCFYEFLTDALLKGDAKSRWESYKAARESGALNANEIRSMENRNAIPGAAGEAYLWPLNMAPAGQQQNDGGRV